MEFNHISKDLDQETIDELKKMYEFYHKLAYCYKTMHKRYKRIYKYLTISSVFLTGVGGAVVGVTLQPAVIGVTVGCAFLIQTYLEQKKLGRKVERLKLAYTSYEKILTQLRSYLRGMSYDSKVFLSDVRVVDDMVIDECPPVANWVTKKYLKTKTQQQK